MRNVPIFIFLIFSFYSLYAMKGESIPKLYYSDLPREMDVAVMGHVMKDSVESIQPKDAVWDIAHYRHEKSVRSVAWSSDGYHTASGGDDGVLKVLNLETGMWQGYKNSGPVKAVAWSPDGSRFAWGGHFGQLLVARLTENLFEIEDGILEKAQSIAWSPNGTQIAWSGSEDNKIKIWDINNDATFEIMSGDFHTQIAWPTQLAIKNLNEFILANVSDDRETGHVVYERYDYRGLVSFSSSPDGRCYAGVQNRVEPLPPRGCFIIFDMDGIRLNKEYENTFCSIAWSSDGKYIALGDSDGKVMILDAATQQLLAEYKQASAINTIAWSSIPGEGPKAAFIMSGSEDGFVVIKTIMPLLLDKLRINYLTLAQYMLLERFKDSLLYRKKSLIIGQKERAVLEEMQDLKKLLVIESNEPTQNKVAKLWRLRLWGKKPDEEEMASSRTGESRCVVQ